MSPVMLCATSCSKTVVLMPCRGILMRNRFAVATLLVAVFDIATTFGGCVRPACAQT